MNGADLLILAVLLFSVVVGMARGFVREAIALLAWLGGIWLAWRYAPLVEPMLGGMLDAPPASTWAARAIILFAVLILGWGVASVLTHVLRHSSLSILVDRLLGVFFGVLRGAVVIAIFVMVGDRLQLDETSWWKRSTLLPYAVESAGWIQAFAETGLQQLMDQANLQLNSASSSTVRGS